MRILLHSNAPHAGSGYGVQTRLFLPRLRDAGHDVAVSAFWGLMGNTLEWNGIRIYPGGLTPYGVDIGVRHAQDFNADGIVALIDAWVLRPMADEAKGKGLPLIMWSPVDQGPPPDGVLDAARASTAFFCYSQWGTGEMLDAGVEQTRYVPLAVDTKEFYPVDKAAARSAIGVPEDAYVVGMVAANKCPYARKAFPQALEAFARFAESHDDAHLFLHTEVTQAHGGWNIAKMIEDYKIHDRTTVADRYQLHSGIDQDRMRMVFNAFDVLLSPSMGEGFGVPIIEAQACGVPVVVGGWTSMPELVGAGHVIAKDDATRMRTAQGGYWYVPHIDAIVEGLEDVYRDKRSPNTALAKAMEYDADVVTRDYLIPALAEFIDLPDPPAPGPVEVFEFAA